MHNYFKDFKVKNVKIDNQRIFYTARLFDEDTGLTNTLNFEFSVDDHNNIKECFEQINNYYKKIWTKIYTQSISYDIDINKFIKVFFDSYICLYQDIFIKFLEKEDEVKFQTLIFILEHFNI